MPKHNRDIEDRQLIQQKTMMLLGIFITALVCANLVGTKIITLLGISVSVGIFAYPLTFICTDIVEEVRGRKITEQFVKIGIIACLISFLLVYIGVSLPPAGRYTINESYVAVFSSSLRMIIASLIAFVVAQYHDIWAFNFWKKKTNGKMLWLRNNLSTIFSQLIDTTLFMFIAFYHVTPKFSAGFIATLIFPYWIFKVLFAFLDTPFVYLGVRWLKGKN